MKKLASIAVSGVLILGLLAGCGTTAPGSNAGTGSTPAPSAAPKEIKVGGDLEITGGAATFGNSVKNAVEMAFDEQNKAGGVNGAQLKFVVADNKTDSGESTAAATKLITQDKVVAIIGAVASSNTLAASPVAIDNKIPLLSPTSTATKVTIDDNGKLKPWIFRSCFIDPFQGQVAANFASNTLKAKKAAIYIDQKSDYSKGLATEFEKNFKASGGSVTGTEQYVAGSDKDFRATLTRIKGTNPDLVFVPGYYNEVALIVKQAREMGMTMPFLGGDGWDSPELVNIAGAANLNNTFFVNHVAADDPSVKPFVDAYKAKYNTVPDALAFLGYDAAKMLIAAFKTAGTSDPAKVRDALEQTKNFQGVTGTISVDPATHNPVKSAVIIQMKDGKQTFMTRVNP